MKTLLSVLCFVIACSAFAQAPKKLVKVLPDDLIFMQSSTDYPWRPKGEMTYHPSLTYKGDTTGVSNSHEFVLFRDSISFYQEKELFKFFSDDYVSNWDYNQFVYWVIDSIQREMIYVNDDPTGNNSIPDEKIGEMLNYEETYYDEVNEQWTNFDLSQPYINRGLFAFNWDYDWWKKIRVSQYVPLIEEMYVWPSQRFNKSKIYDERKFVYRYHNGFHWPSSEGALAGHKHFMINIAQDKDVWALNSIHPNDVHHALAHNYSDENWYLGYPVIGLQGTQIDAYMEWLEIKLQQDIDAKKLGYRIKVTLPSEEELVENDCNCDKTFGVHLDSVDMTEQWQITNAEYAEFCNWVEDSLCREAIYMNEFGRLEMEDVGDMLAYDDVFYDEVNLSWNEFDPADAWINRERWSFDWDFDWRKEFDKNITDSLTEYMYDESGFIKHKLVYKYQWLDLERKAQWGDLEWTTIKNQGKETERSEYVPKDYWKGRELNLYHGVRAHKYFDPFIIEEGISIYPTVKCERHTAVCYEEFGDLGKNAELKDHGCGKCPDAEKSEIEPYDFTSNPEGLVTGLSYGQAKAYYNWKYQRTKVESKDLSPIYQDLIPSEEEFIRAQKGEKMYQVAEKVPFPSPLFRYVIHVYSK